MSLKNRIIGLAAVGAAALALAPAAQASCNLPAAPVFAPWQDNALYSLVNDGGFEAGAPTWTLSGGAKVVRDLDDGIRAKGVTDDYALEIGAGGSATSPAICVATDSAFYRLFANAVAGRDRGANLRVEILVGGLVVKSNDLTSPTGRSVPTPRLAFVPRVADALLGGVADATRLTSTVRIRVSSLNGATVRVDDVHMDPRMH